jgi:Zn-dependent membrane protease YugP
MGFDIALMIVGALIAIVGFYATLVSLWLMVKYIRFNRMENSAGLSGKEVARKILDDNGLNNIKVKVTGSLLFGNSYSHYFKKVRLRRFTRNEKSLTSLGIGAQKASLAILDKEGDPEMKKRIRLYPLITFGPFMFVPLLLIGTLLDYFVFNQTGYIVLAMGGLGVLFYVYALVLSVLTLKTEKKAQAKAYEILKKDKLITNEELELLKDLFHLYNVQYINDIILSSLELIRVAIQIAATFKDSSLSKK